jgi:hypothetical protein
MFNNLTK